MCQYYKLQPGIKPQHQHHDALLMVLRAALPFNLNMCYRWVILVFNIFDKIPLIFNRIVTCIDAIFHPLKSRINFVDVDIFHLTGLSM